MIDSIMVHGHMKYRCERCGRSWLMHLEIGVEDWGKNGRPHQPSPMFIRCECGEMASDIGGYIPYPSVMPLFPGMHYFAYDHSGSERACGHPAVYAAGGAE